MVMPGWFNVIATMPGDMPKMALDQHRPVRSLIIVVRGMRKMCLHKTRDGLNSLLCTAPEAPLGESSLHVFTDGFPLPGTHAGGVAAIRDNFNTVFCEQDVDQHTAVFFGIPDLEVRECPNRLLTSRHTAQQRPEPERAFNGKLDLTAMPQFRLDDGSLDLIKHAWRKSPPQGSRGRKQMFKDTMHKLPAPRRAAATKTATTTAKASATPTAEATTKAAAIASATRPGTGPGAHEQADQKRDESGKQRRTY